MMLCISFNDRVDNTLRVFKAVPTANISFYLNNTKMHNINHSERLPYEKLAVLGIDRERPTASLRK